MISPAEFFQKAYEQFMVACRSSGGPHQVSFRLAQKEIHLFFASPSLIPVIVPAFQHLKTSLCNGKADLEIYLWDYQSTGIPMVQPPWGKQDYLPKGAIKGYNKGDIRAIYLFDRNALSLVNFTCDKAIYWVPDARLVPYFETGAPLLGILPQWFFEKGKLFIHAGAVGVKDKGVLLVGKGGSGKSTTALRCLKHHSLYYLADDYCLLDFEPPIQIHSVYCSGKLDPVQVEASSSLKLSLYNSHRLRNEKALFLLFPLMANRLVKSVPLTAIFIPKITGKGHTFLSPASPTDAFRALAPSTILQLPGFGHKTSEMIAKLVQAVPAFYLNLGNDPELVPEVIYDYLVEHP